MGISKIDIPKDKSMKQTRKYANHWEWTDKPTKELGIAEDLLKSMRLAGDNRFSSPRIGPSPNQAPDCIISEKNENNIAVELCELVSSEAVAENQKGKEVYYDWRPEAVLNKIRKILENKDGKVYHGGPYSKIIVLIHTDEPVLSYKQYEVLLAPEKFNGLRQVNEAFLLFSYEPSIKRCPYVKLTLK